MILPDYKLRELFPMCTKFGPCSIDLQLGNEFIIPQASSLSVYSRSAFELTYSFPHQWIQSDNIVIEPHQFILATTIETITIPDDCMGEIYGRSSIGRQGLQVQNAGLLDSGWTGQVTLELYNQAPYALILRAGQYICQMAVWRMEGKAKQPYSGKYQNQSGVTVSRFSMEVK